MMTSSPNNKSASKSGHRKRRLLAARLLMRYLLPLQLKIQPFRQHTSQGYDYEVYEPQKPFRKMIMMVYGLTIAGEREARLVRFAQSFAVAGFRVVVPVLPGIKSINIESGDLDIIKEVIATLQKESDKPIGIVGFSIGGGLAIVAATDPGFYGFVDPIILLGPYYSLPELWSDLWRKDTHLPTTDQEWNNFIWQQMILAYREHQTLNIRANELDELEDFLRGYCFESSLARKLAAYERLVKPHGIFDPRSVPVDINELKRLSPCNKLERLPSRVSMIHDPHDRLSPCQQSIEIFKELKQRGDPLKQRLLISTMFSHINPRAILNLPDLIATLDIFGELFL